MKPPKSLSEREEELRTLLGSPAGKQELSELASRYQAVDGRAAPVGKSVITYILVRERELGLIVG